MTEEATEQTAENFVKEAENLQLQYWPAKILKEKCGLITDFNKELKELAAKMLIKMAKHNGIGLAASQIGENIQLIVINVNDKIIELCNPEIVFQSEEIIVDYEGCLSFPGISLPVKRSFNIIVKYQDIDGLYKQESFNDMTARVVQHEIDHLNGITFLDKTNRLKRQLIVKKFEKTKKKVKKYEKAFRKIAQSTNKKGGL